MSSSSLSHINTIPISLDFANCLTHNIKGHDATSISFVVNKHIPNSLVYKNGKKQIIAEFKILKEETSPKCGFYIYAFPREFYPLADNHYLYHIDDDFLTIL